MKTLIEVGRGGGGSIPMTFIFIITTNISIFNVNLGTIMFAARKRLGEGGLVPPRCYVPDG